MLFFMEVLASFEESDLVDNGSSLGSSGFCKCYAKFVIFIVAIFTLSSHLRIVTI